MSLDCTICTAMLRNGAAIGGTKTITAHQLTEVPGKLEHITECSVAVLGTTLRYIAVVPVISRSRRAVGGGTGVFAWR